MQESYSNKVRETIGNLKFIGRRQAYRLEILKKEEKAD